MKPAILIGVAIVAVLSVAAIAFAATSGGSDGETAQASPTPANTATPVPPTATPTPEEPTAEPTQTADTPATSEPEPTVVPDTPIPSEPPFTVTPAPTQPLLPAGRYAEPAPIDQLDVRIAESFPPQYFVYIQAGLPSGCAQQYTHSFTVSGNLIEVEVLNSFPEGNPICTAIYGTYELNIPLGSDFVSGETYTVSVNDGAAETTFTAQ
jgi:hypothetical protein